MGFFGVSPCPSVYQRRLAIVSDAIFGVVVAYWLDGLIFLSAAPSTSPGPDSWTKTISLRFFGSRPGLSLA